MDAVCLKATSNKHLSNLAKDISDDKQTVETFVSQRARLADLPASEHALLEVCLGTRGLPREVGVPFLSSFFNYYLSGRLKTELHWH